MSGGSESGFVIDLGADLEPVAAPEWTPSRRLARRLRLAVPVLAVLFLVAAAAPAAVDPLRLLARVPIGVQAYVMIVGNDLYVFDISGSFIITPDDAYDGPNVLRDYRLDTGGLRWSVRVPELPNESTLTFLGGRLIVSMAATDSTGQQHTVALDARTGRQLWTSDLGFAVPVAGGGMLVGSTPPPPGFNFVGTNVKTSFRLLDADTGRGRWSVVLDEDCLARPAGPAGGLPDTLVTLCPSTHRLTEIDMSDGHVTAARDVDLGDPGRNFLLPVADRLPEPQLAVVGDTILVAHANAPVPAVDGYATSDLTERWHGVPVRAGQHVDRCGTAPCVLDADGAGQRLDPRTGAATGSVSPRTGPPDGALVLVRPGAAADTAQVVPAVPAGTDAAVPQGGPQVEANTAESNTAESNTTDSNTTVLLARWRSGGQPAQMSVLFGVRPSSCLHLAGYLACVTATGQLALWRL